MKPSHLIPALSRVDPARVSALAVVLAIHGLFAVALFSVARPAAEGGQQDGKEGQSAMQVRFVPRSQPSPPPPPPPRLPAPATPPESAARLVAAQPAPVAPVAVAPEVTAVGPATEAAPPIHATSLNSMLPFQTAEPIYAAQEAPAPAVLGPTEALPADFASHVDAVPMELAQYRKTNSPKYLEAARAAGQQGVVVLRVLVDEAGYPAAIQVAKSTAGEALTLETIRAVASWRFKPAEREGAPVKGVILVPVYFLLDKLPASFRSWHSAGPANRKAH